ncbi:hypothetical protein DL93DRAFT_2103684 [Clavulina sp. PMI_390]|nr:hypothetical protein DL93DRAFT_2103684 [Clavulina sp. PMI_390]
MRSLVAKDANGSRMRGDGRKLTEATGAPSDAPPFAQPVDKGDTGAITSEHNAVVFAAGSAGTDNRRGSVLVGREVVVNEVVERFLGRRTMTGEMIQSGRSLASLATCYVHYSAPLLMKCTSSDGEDLGAQLLQSGISAPKLQEKFEPRGRGALGFEGWRDWNLENYWDSADGQPLARRRRTFFQARLPQNPGL